MIANTARNLDRMADGCFPSGPSRPTPSFNLLLSSFKNLTLIGESPGLLGRKSAPNSQFARSSRRARARWLRRPSYRRLDWPLTLTATILAIRFTTW